MTWLERTTKRMMLMVGILGVVVMYSGFLYLMLFTGSSAAIPWYFLLSPWVCVFFGLRKHQQHRVIAWFIVRLPGRS